MIRSFLQWLEDTGLVYDQTNGPEYAARGVGSRVAANNKKKLSDKDKNEKSIDPDAVFGQKRKLEK